MIDKIGRYEILSQLGQGAMGIVYEARDPRIGRIVALKTIHPGSALSDNEEREFYERFYREAQTAGNLSHPNIVTIFDADEDEEQKISFIAMEYIEGQSLQQMLDGDRIFTPEEAAAITVQIGEGLGYAHKNGIIHRDIKPANIILTPEDRVKITDFGIARVESSSLTRTGQFLGTPFYMAPEQIAGGQIDGRSDLFSLAVVFYQLLTREKPFSGNNITTILYKIVNQEPLPPTRLNMGLSSGYDGVLGKGLAKKPDERYQNAEQMISDLRQLLKRMPPVHAGAGATVAVDRDDGGGTKNLDKTRLIDTPATDSSATDPPAAAALTGSAAAPPAKRTSKGGSQSLLIGFAAALTVVVLFLVIYLVFLDGDTEPATGDSSALLQKETLPPAEIGSGAVSLQEDGRQSQETATGPDGSAGNVTRVSPSGDEPPPASDTPAETETGRTAGDDQTTPEESTKTEDDSSTVPAPREEQRPATRPAEITTPPSKPAERTESRSEPARQRPPVTQPKPEEIQEAPAQTGTVEPESTETVTAGSEETPETASVEEEPPPPQEYGYLDIRFKHQFESGRLVIRAKGDVVYDEPFSSSVATDGSGWKKFMKKATKLVKSSFYEDQGIGVPVGRYTLEVKVTVPGESISPANLNVRFRADQERCLSIISKKLNSDKLQLSWGCDDEDDDDEDEDDEEEEKD